MGLYNGIIILIELGLGNACTFPSCRDMVQSSAGVCAWGGLCLQIPRAGQVITPHRVLWCCSLVLTSGLSWLLGLCRKCADQSMCRMCYIRATCPRDTHWFTVSAIHGDLFPLEGMGGPVWMGDIQDDNYKHLVASSWQPSASVLGPEWSKNKSLDFSKVWREGILSKTSGVRQVGKVVRESKNCYHSCPLRQWLFTLSTCLPCNLLLSFSTIFVFWNHQNFKKSLETDASCCFSRRTFFPP